MAEDEVNYASVVFKAKTEPQPEAKTEEETLYDAVKERSDTAEPTGDTHGSAGLSPDKNPDRRRRLLVCCLAASCVVLLLGIIAAGVYLTTLSLEMNQLKENQTSLLTVNDNLTAENQQLRIKIENMTQDLRIKNISEAFRTINAYCPKPDTAERKCKPCLDGWLNSEKGCYAINNAKNKELKTWEEAAADCRAKNSHLAVIETEEEKTFVTANSWRTDPVIRYWIGLRAEGGKWKWINGADLNQGSWISDPTADGQCVTSLQDSGWLSESCAERRRWICEQAALTV